MSGHCSEIQPTVIKKYVDDVLITLPESDIESTQYIINSFHNKLQFTMEKESNSFIWI